MPDAHEFRWYVHRYKLTASSRPWRTELRRDGVRVPGTYRMWITWGGAMGHVNLEIARRTGVLK